jgi:transposase
VQGGTADDPAYWLAGATPAWRDAVQMACIDLCTIYASAGRRMLPHAVLTADLFHVAQLAVKATGDVRRRVVQARYAAAPATPSTASRTWLRPLRTPTISASGGRSHVTNRRAERLSMPR